jgi:predicted DNA-binding transcriptional regulator YafY
MRRGDRLFELIQVLRRASGPLTAEEIAAELETSKRTVYRDIASLMAQRVPIRGEAGIGYVLERGFDMPPLMLSTDEVEAVALGAQWVVAHGDSTLARASLNVLAKIAAILPKELKPLVEDPSVGTPPSREEDDAERIDLARVRGWSRQGKKVTIRYADEAGRESERTVWPFMVGYVGKIRIIMSYCELRQDFRLFRTDRIRELQFLDVPYPEPPVTLRRRWLAAMKERRAAKPAPRGAR